MSLLTTLMGLVKPQDNDNSRAHFVTVGAGYHANMDKLDSHTHDNDTAGAAVKRVASGLDAGKPVAGNAGRVYVATDTGLMYVDTGAAWVALNLHGAGSITDAMLVSLAGGKVVGVVATATEATHAINADYATNAAFANEGDFATEAAHAGGADNATNATHAISADSATNATHATHADSADTATTTTHAALADTATYAVSADYAPHATTATTADALSKVPACRVFHSVAQTVADGATVSLDFNTELFDTDAIHDLSTNPSCLSCKTAGIYLITAGVQWSYSYQGVRWIELMRNASFIIAHEDSNASDLNLSTIQHLSTVYALDVGDYIQLRAMQGSGASRSVLSVPHISPEFSMVRLGPAS